VLEYYIYIHIILKGYIDILVYLIKVVLDGEREGLPNIQLQNKILTPSFPLLATLPFFPLSLSRHPLTSPLLKLIGIESPKSISSPKENAPNTEEILRFLKSTGQFESNEMLFNYLKEIPSFPPSRNVKPHPNPIASRAFTATLATNYTNVRNSATAREFNKILKKYFLRSSTVIHTTPLTLVLEFIKS